MSTGDQAIQTDLQSLYQHLILNFSILDLSASHYTRINQVLYDSIVNYIDSGCSCKTKIAELLHSYSLKVEEDISNTKNTEQTANIKSDFLTKLIARVTKTDIQHQDNDEQTKKLLITLWKTTMVLIKIKMKGHQIDNQIQTLVNCLLSEDHPQLFMSATNLDDENI